MALQMNGKQFELLFFFRTVSLYKVSLNRCFFIHYNIFFKQFVLHHMNNRGLPHTTVRGLHIFHVLIIHTFWPNSIPTPA